MIGVTSAAKRGSIYLPSQPLSSLILSTTNSLRVRQASLSAIHRGLKKSDRVQYGESRPSNDDFEARIRSSRRDDRTRKALEGSGSARQQHKLRKKVDRKTYQDEDESGRQTRRKRFVNSDSSFGKKSLVYQLKHGALKETASRLNLREPVLAREHQPGDRLSFLDRRSHRGHVNASRDSREAEETKSSYESESGETMQATRTRRSFQPTVLSYTTAASQFLYGKSVVKAALEQRRRAIYKLYVYDGENRRESKERDVIVNLAKAAGVEVLMVPSANQRMMDKMSMGRPHNGFVLETSPLPQLPVRCLGALEQTPSRLGFHIELDHQTKEEQAINGEDTFVRKSNTFASRPFVLLLHEILDPGNLGALLRTASYMGIDAVGITNRSSSALTPVVLKSAAGAAEEVTIFTVDDALQFLKGSQAAGWKAFAAVAPPERKLAKMHSGKFITVDDIENESPLDEDPCILVLGNEGHGLPRDVKVASDFELSVPRFTRGSSVDSLNVSVAAGLLCHTFVKACGKRRTSKTIEVPSDEHSQHDAAEPMF